MYGCTINPEEAIKLWALQRSAHNFCINTIQMFSIALAILIKDCLECNYIFRRKFFIFIRN